MDNKSVVIERTVNAPASLVWDMWTKAEHFSQWYGPTGASIPTANMDAQVGGKRLICMEMQTPNGPMQMWFAGEYLEVKPTTRLRYTEAMSDADGNIMSPSDMGMPEGTPATTEIIVEIEDLGATTKMTMTHAGVPADSPGAAGWNMALDKFEARAAELAA